LKQVVCDMLVYHPLSYFPVFYLSQEIIRGNVESPSKTVHDAMQKYIPNAVDDWINLWKIFIPVSLFQNSVCPVYLRVPCTATAGFFYCIILSMTRGDDINKKENIAQRMHTMPDEEFEKCLATIRSRYRDNQDGVGMNEFANIMAGLGLSEASVALFHALNDRGRGTVDVGCLVDGLELLAGQCLPEERVKTICDNPDFLPANVPPKLRRLISRRMLNMTKKEFEERLASVRSRQWANKDGLNHDEFVLVMRELGLGEASTPLFEALDSSDGLFPSGSGLVDLERFIRGMNLLSGRCSPEERMQFLSNNPNFLPQEVGPRLTSSECYL